MTTAFGGVTNTHPTPLLMTKESGVHLLNFVSGEDLSTPMSFCEISRDVLLRQTKQRDHRDRIVPNAG